MKLPEEQCHRIFAGEHPLKVWREHLGLDVTDLRRETKIPFSRLNQIERCAGKSIYREEAKLLGRVMDIPADELMQREHPCGGCYDLDVDEDEILAREPDA